MIDFHSHLLPDIDDGSKSMDDSVAMIRGMVEQGVTEIVVTPHYVVETIYTSSRAKNTKLCDELRERLQREGIDVKIHLGNEIYIDKSIASLIRRRQISPIAGTQYLLVELPMSGEFDQYQDILKALMVNGWKIVLAHPERYHAFQSDYTKIEELRDMGVLFQSNLGSIIGQYGKKSKKTIKKMLKDDLIFCFGTDIHHQRDYSEISKAKKKLRKFYKGEKLDQILVCNPKRILDFQI